MVIHEIYLVDGNFDAVKSGSMEVQGIMPTDVVATKEVKKDTDNDIIIQTGCQCAGCSAQNNHGQFKRNHLLGEICNL